MMSCICSLTRRLSTFALFRPSLLTPTWATEFSLWLQACWSLARPFLVPISCSGFRWQLEFGEQGQGRLIVASGDLRSA